jgi:hypothetical protein
MFDDLNQNDLMVIPKVPSGVSGTALAASLLRDGWSVCPTSFVLISLFPYLKLLLDNIHCFSAC